MQENRELTDNLLVLMKSTRGAAIGCNAGCCEMPMRISQIDCELRAIDEFDAKLMTEAALSDEEAIGFIVRFVRKQELRWILLAIASWN